MSYYTSLAFHLRIRQLPEPRVAEVLNEAQELASQAGQDPEQQFGPAAAYAARFPKGDTRSRATRIAIGLLCAAIAVMAVDLVMSLTGDTHLRIGSVRLLPMLIPVEVAVIIGAIIADHRLPAGFRAAHEQTD